MNPFLTRRVVLPSIALSIAMGSASFAQQRTGTTAPSKNTPSKTTPTTAKNTPVAEAPKVTKPELVAVVNNHSISRQQLADECLRRYGKDVLESMVSKYLVMQACAQSNITVTEADVRAEVERMAGKFGLSTDRYLRLLHEERDIAPEDYQRDIVWPMLCLQRLTADKVQVTQQEFDEAYNSQYGPAVQCRMIMVAKEDKIRNLHKQAMADPAQFGRIALEESEDEISASVRGMIPPVRRSAGDTNFEKIAFELNENQVSEPFPVGDQWILLQCVRRIPASQPDPKAMPIVRQRITDDIKERKTREIANTLFQELQQQAQVVNVLNDPQLRKQYPGVAAIINGRQVPIVDVAEECIKRHGKLVLEGEITRKILETTLKERQITISQQDMDAEVAHAAELFGYVTADGKPDVEKWLKATLEQNPEHETVELYLRDAVWPSVALKKLTTNQVQIAEEDLRKGFEANYGPRAEVLAIVLSDQRTAQKVWDLARANNTEQFFSELATQYSIEPVSRNNLGKVPPIRKYSGQPVLEQEAFSLKTGELSGIVATGDQYIILRSQGYTKPVVSDLNQVREELTRDLYEKKTRDAMNDEFERLRSIASIDNFLTGSSQSGVQKAAARMPGGALTK